MSAAAFADAPKPGGCGQIARLPDAQSSTIQQAILYRMGTKHDGRFRWDENCGLPNSGVRSAIDDIYSGSSRGERFFTMHVVA